MRFSLRKLIGRSGHLPESSVPPSAQHPVLCVREFVKSRYDWNDPLTELHVDAFKVTASTVLWLEEVGQERHAGLAENASVRLECKNLPNLFHIVRIELNWFAECIPL